MFLELNVIIIFKFISMWPCYNLLYLFSMSIFRAKICTVGWRIGSNRLMRHNNSRGKWRKSNRSWMLRFFVEENVIVWRKDGPFILAESIRMPIKFVDLIDVTYVGIWENCSDFIGRLSIKTNWKIA